MPDKPVSYIVTKKCEYCTKILVPKVFNGGEKERICAFLRRRFCDSFCRSRSGVCRLNKKHTEVSRQKMSISAIGKHDKEKNGHWTGNKVTYVALHKWVSGNYGFPSECEHCGLISQNHRKIHWSNVSKLYKRDRDDWQRLCVSCHKIYDSANEYIYVG